LVEIEEDGQSRMVLVDPAQDDLNRKATALEHSMTLSVETAVDATEPDMPFNPDTEEVAQIEYLRTAIAMNLQDAPVSLQGRDLHLMRGIIGSLLR
jgi:hypothetical protein